MNINNWKRVAILLLCMVMLLGNIPATSFATEIEDVKLVCTGQLDCAAENHDENCEKRAADVFGLCSHHPTHEGCNYVENAVLCDHVCSECAISVSSEELGGFTYGMYDASANTIKITGYTGPLEPGQNLVVPSEIEGKTVVAIEGTYGTVGAGLGTFTLPDTLQTIKNLHVYGFTGTLVIPASVTSIAQPDGLYFSDIEELVVNATMEMYFSNKYIHYNNHENPLKKIVIGDGIKYFIASMYFDAEYYPNLETVKVSDNVQYIGAKNSNATFYLKKFEAPIIRQLNNNTPPSYGLTGETTEARGLALGLEGCKYYYTNEGEEFPVEQLFITEKTGFTTFREGDKSYPGLNSGETGTVKIATSPINATDVNNAIWTSSDPSVATVENGRVLGVCAGKATITVSLNGISQSFEMMVKGVSASGFNYSAIDGTDTIKITGYTGTLEAGQNLVVPSEIDGKTVVAIEGMYGDRYDIGAGYGEFILPNTLQRIYNLHLMGFTGTLTIPESVTDIDPIDGIYFTDIEELVINATMETYTSNKYIGYNDNQPLKKIVIGGTVKYFLASSYFDGGNGFGDSTPWYPNLTTVIVSDNVRYISAGNNTNVTFYLKRFDTTVHEIGPVSAPGGGTIYKPLDTGVATSQRGVAIGLKNCKYYYTNEGEEFPVEQLFITEKTGFTTFREEDKSYPGLNSGETGTVKIATSPINATDTANAVWTSSNPSVATVEDGEVLGVCAGKTTITVSLNGISQSFEMMVKGASASGFNYSAIDGTDTIKITGYTGTLEAGQNLVVPSEIDGKTVVAIEGMYGDRYDVGAGYGRFILPNTLQHISNVHLMGFTGTLVIPDSVTDIDPIDGIYFTDIEELVINATMETYAANAYAGYNSNNPLKKIVIGNGIKYFCASMYFNSSNYPNLESVEISDSVRYIEANGSAATFYLKKFDTTVHEIGPVSAPGGGTIYKPLDTGVATSQRGVAIGLKNCKYYYTNEGEEFPVEQLFITEKTGFTTFREDDSSSIWGSTAYPGLYAGWSGSVKVNTSPINATGSTVPEWSSSNPSVATVKDGVVTAEDIGSTTIRGRLGDLSVEVPLVVRGILIVSSDDGVNADNLVGNMELPNEGINEKEGLSLELEVDKLNPKDWKHWGQLKKVLEEAYEKSLDCSDVFDIQVTLKNGVTTWKVQPIDGKKISIWMPIEDATDISKRILVHVKDDGSYEEIDFAYESIDGVHGIRFETGSFSDFALLLATDRAPNETTEPTVPSEATEPTVPSEATEPTVPSEATEPTVPSEATEPTAPSETTKPSAPDEHTKPTDVPATGDHMNILLYMVLGVVSGCLCITMILAQKRKKQV